LLIDATECIPSNRQQTLKNRLVLDEVLLGYCAHPVGRLHSSFCILPYNIRKIRSTSRHSVTSFTEAQSGCVF
jgi:hypothetical protein